MQNKLMAEALQGGDADEFEACVRSLSILADRWYELGERKYRSRS